MTDVKIIAKTQPLIRNEVGPKEYNEGKLHGYLTADEFIAYAARVSNPGNQSNHLSAPKLINYLIRNKHWSPFEMVHVVAEINTTRDIAHQIIRHRSFSYQEFSQRYADPTKDMGFTISEARLQDNKNRQNSIETEDEELQKSWVAKQQQMAFEGQLAYKWAIENGIAKEVARKVLPEGLTNTRLYMSGSLRSWIHYVDVRTEKGTQKEHRLIADQMQKELLAHFPSLEGYWRPEPEIEESVQETVNDWWWNRIWK